MSGTLPESQRSDIMQEQAEYVLPIESFRKYDDLTSHIPVSPTGSHLGVTSGTFGSATPLIVSSDAGNTTVTQKLRFTYTLPPEYDDGQRVYVRVYGSMASAASATATVDISAYESNFQAGLGSDLCLTSATTINSTSYATCDFTIDPTGLVAGDQLDIQLTFAATDVGGSGKTARIGKISMVLDIRG
jgi:hypothetical protein